MGPEETATFGDPPLLGSLFLVSAAKINEDTESRTPIFIHDVRRLLHQSLRFYCRRFHNLAI